MTFLCFLQGSKGRYAPIEIPEIPEYLPVIPETPPHHVVKALQDFYDGMPKERSRDRSRSDDR